MQTPRWPSDWQIVAGLLVASFVFWVMIAGVAVLACNLAFR
jgi:hypothetical protein